MSHCRRLAATAVFGVGASLAGAQVTQQGAAYLFRLHLTKGEKINFRIPFSISGMGNGFNNLQFGMHLKVLEVGASGRATVHCNVDMGSFPMPGNAPKSGDFVVDQRGRVRDQGSAPVGFCVIYPKDPVNVGGKFVAPLPSAIGGQGGQATFKFLGFSGTGAHRQARLSYTVTGHKAPGGTLLVRVSDGVIDKFYTSFVAMTPQAGQPLTVSATIIRK